MACYRILPEPDKMIEAVEYIEEHSPSAAERSNVATDFVSFMHQRGKTDQSVARYEEKLKKDAKDPTALAVLSTAEPAAAQSPYDGMIATHAAANNVPVSLVHRVVVRESRYQPHLIGRGGTIGSRNTGSHKPIAAMANFTGPGFDSMKLPSISGRMRVWIVRAVV